MEISGCGDRSQPAFVAKQRLIGAYRPLSLLRRRVIWNWEPIELSRILRQAMLYRNNDQFYIAVDTQFFKDSVAVAINCLRAKLQIGRYFTDFFPIGQH
jgi:hypothetical protein